MVFITFLKQLRNIFLLNLFLQITHLREVLVFYFVLFLKLHLQSFFLFQLLDFCHQRTHLINKLANNQNMKKSTKNTSLKKSKPEQNGILERTRQRFVADCCQEESVCHQNSRIVVITVSRDESSLKEIGCARVVVDPGGISSCRIPDTQM